MVHPQQCSNFQITNESIISQNSLRDQLPYRERYQAQVRGRASFLCQECKKNFSKSALNSHIRNKHRGQNRVKVDCSICQDHFDDHIKAIEHNEQYHKIYDCFECQEKFSDFDNLKSHLKSEHEGQVWPWICGFCDLVLFYELDFQIHIKQHTERSPYSCPLCQVTSKSNSKLRQHISSNHLVSIEDPVVDSTMMTERRNSHSKSKSVETRDENAVNREIAALLLNLHSSRGHEHPAARAEDLSVNKPTVDTAMDLSKSKYNGNSAMPLTITKLSSPSMVANSKTTLTNGVDFSKTVISTVAELSIPNGTPATNPYSFYPSLASMGSLTPSTLATMNSNYLLQNLLLGKMQQIAGATTTNTTAVATTTSSSSSPSPSPLSFPTQPLPAQVLSLPSVTNSGLKPPASVLKSSSFPNGNNTSSPALTSTTSSISNMPSTLQQLSNGTPATNIPLLCGQIVAQLNGLLFLCHSLSSSHVEVSLQNQLTAIYGRLQEIVSMVEQTKKQQEESCKEPKANEMIHKQLERMKESKQKEEEKIAKHIQDYQRALMQQQDGKQVAPLKETPASSSVVNLLKKQAQANLDAKNEHHMNGHNGGDHIMHQEVESTSSTTTASPGAAARRRRGRPPKNSNMDLTYSPPEKKSRVSTEHQQHQPESTTNGTSPINGTGNTLVGGDLTTMTTSNANQTTKVASTGNGKGIRNRVFCGECTGCLKNDDCGHCRYCQDKTKFGGQNRLRQKCLHRRCQMDSHRKRANNNSISNNNSNSNSNANNMTNVVNGAPSVVSLPNIPVTSSFKDSRSARQSPSPNSIYSGVDLARLAATAVAAEKLQVKEEVKKVDTPAVIITPIIEDKPQQDIGGLKKEEEEKEIVAENDKSSEVRRATRSKPKAATEERKPSLSDEDDIGDPKAQKQSRIDKWKAKHEAMLKQAADGKTKKKNKKGKKNSKNQDQKDSNNEDEDLVVEEDEEEEEEKKENDDEGEDEDEEDEIELPNIDPNGVSIDLDSRGSSKPHTRQSSVVQQQQHVLSV